MEGIAAGKMTKGERDDLIRLVKQREKVSKSAAEQRSAALLAEFEQKISAVYAFDDNDVWASAFRAADSAFKEANRAIAEKAKELGIPEEFQPRLMMAWARRGQNEMAERRAELRRVAKAEIEAMEKTARVEIESVSIRAQTEILANSLTSEAAVAFLAKLPTVETLMPTLELGPIEKRVDARIRRLRHLQ